MIITRAATAKILESAKYFPVIAILGPRQSGKTTLAQAIFPTYQYVSLEDLDIRRAAQEDPRSFLIANDYGRGIIIDEFQYAPELLSYIQTAVDQQKRLGYFILTGSQNFLMNRAITQSLAGRVSIHTLLPLSIAELSTHKILPTEIETMLYQGSYPAIYAQHIPPMLLYKNYLQTYIERDVRQLSQVGDLALFQTFIALCATRMGQSLNLTALGNDCGINTQTVQRWLTILQSSYIIFLLQPYHHANLGKRLVKTPKLYFYDTGLACQLLKIKPDELALHPSRSSLFEALIIAETFKHYYNSNQIPCVYFWRDQAGHEIDCILDEGQKVILLGIKTMEIIFQNLTKQQTISRSPRSLSRGIVGTCLNYFIPNLTYKFCSRTISQRFFDSLKYWQIANAQTASNTPQHPGFIVYAGNTTTPRGQATVISWQTMQQIFAH